jgi:hypothetical protein
MRLARLVLLSLILLLQVAPALAAESGSVQEVTGALGPGEVAVYDLTLVAGQTLYAYAEGVSGNLDPRIGVTTPDTDVAIVRAEMHAAVVDALAANQDPLEATRKVLDELLLAWNDDGGGGQAAALEFRAPADGDYRLIVAGGILSAGQITTGDYRLLVGIDAPEVLTGEAIPSGEPFVTLDAEVSELRVAAEEVTGELSADIPLVRYTVAPLNPGETLYAYVEATSGDLAPVLTLRSYAGKALVTANAAGKASTAQLQYTAPERAEDYTLAVSAGEVRGIPTTGSYRLLVGRNAPEVLTGQAETRGNPVLLKPIPVAVGINLEKVVNVSQPDEFFTTVVSIAMQWQDPELAFDPDDCGCSQKVFMDDEFDAFVEEAGGRWPEFVLFNQQGERFPQNTFVRLYPDGSATYFSRSTVDWTVDFDFRRYPLDTQDFQMRLDMLYPPDRYYFTVLDDYNRISENLGEDEFVIEDFTTEVVNQPGATEQIVSTFTFRFTSPRHLDYYVFQIFVPVLLIILVSWVTFFLKDYQMRIEVASANLLLFIAFSFSLADNYPRLGYLTFLDAVMVSTFVITAAVIIYNVLMRRLEARGELARVERIDAVMDWVYPALYIAGFVVLYVVFMGTPA